MEGVDPRGAVVWAADAAFEVGDRAGSTSPWPRWSTICGRSPEASRGCVVLSGCVDRADLAGKVDLVDEARRVVAPGGTLVLLVTDQAAWDAALDPVVRDLLPGRPLHPETWRAGAGPPWRWATPRGTVRGRGACTPSWPRSGR